jgi:hypothetical protein
LHYVRRFHAGTYRARKKEIAENNEISKRKDVVARDQVNSLKREKQKTKKRSTVGGNRSRSRRKRKGNENGRKKNDMKFKYRGEGREGVNVRIFPIRFRVQFPGIGRSNRSL